MNTIVHCLVGFVLAAATLAREAEAVSPNVVLIYAEDISTEIGCYGHPAVRTPVIDRLASEGVLYSGAFCTAPSCTPSRNAMITGVYQTRTGTQDQRRGGVKLPDGVEPITVPLRRAGYYCAVGCGYNSKTDFNFVDGPVFDGGDWSERASGQPFFAQITLGITHRHPGVGWDTVRAAAEQPIDPADVELPPYFPDDPTCRLDWASYLDSIGAMDTQVGEILDRLEAEGLLDETVVIFMGDNGRCHLRGKCWLYDAGLRVPLVIRRPGSARRGEVDDGLYSTLDVAATILEIANAKPPKVFDGRPLDGPDAAARDAVFAARDLIDEVRDPIRAVRTQRYKYIRNYRPENGYAECQYVQENRPMLSAIRALASEGRLTDAQRLIVAERKPVEELYDLSTDPHEINNLVSDADVAETLEDLRARLDAWLEDTGDTGLRLHAAETAQASPN